MPPRCRVTFFDNTHRIRRCLEIDAPVPLAAAETALQWLSVNHVPPEDLDKIVKVEVITTVEYSLRLELIGSRFQIVASRPEAA